MKVPRRNRDRSDSDVTMTPMIDVVFLLLVFFVCTVSTQKLEELLPTNLSLSGSGESEITPPPELTDLGDVIVKVREDGQGVFWDVNGNVYRDSGKVQGVLRLLAKAKSDLPIILDVDGELPLTMAIDLYDWCRLAGFVTIQFAASMPG